jgi:hypothetical protein
MSHWMFRCRDVSRKVSQSMDEALPLHHRMAVRIHLMMCRYCALFRRQLIMIREICQGEDGDRREDGQPDMLSAEAKARIKDALRSPQ